MAEKEAEKQEREQTRLTTRAERGVIPYTERLSQHTQFRTSNLHISEYYTMDLRSR